VRSSLVVRLEYRPGSTLYLIWSQSRSARGTNPALRPLHHIGRSFRDAGSNTMADKRSAPRFGVEMHYSPEPLLGDILVVQGLVQEGVAERLIWGEAAPQRLDLLESCGGTGRTEPNDQPVVPRGIPRHHRWDDLFPERGHMEVGDDSREEVPVSKQMALQRGRL
jgi:hypothetical protein